MHQMTIYHDFPKSMAVEGCQNEKKKFFPSTTKSIKIVVEGGVFSNDQKSQSW
jgi:hypothetical protein